MPLISAQAAFDYNLKYALLFPSPSLTDGASSSTAHGPAARVAVEWVQVPNQPATFEFKRTEGEQFRCIVPWLCSFKPGLQLKFAVSGQPDLSFKVPDQARIGMQLSILARLVRIPAGQTSVTATGLQMKPAPAAGVPPQPVDPVARPAQPAAAPQPAALVLPADTPVEPQPDTVAALPPTVQRQQPPLPLAVPMVASPPAVQHPETSPAASPVVDPAAEEYTGDGNVSATDSVGSELQHPIAEPQQSTPLLTPTAPSRDVDGTVEAMSTRKRRRSALARFHDVPAHASTPDELGAGGWTVGNRVLAVGFAPSGSKAWFHADVIALRSRFPPIVVRYTATLDGCTLALALPSPVTAYVLACDVKADPSAVEEDDAEDDDDDDDDDDNSGGDDDGGDEAGSEDGDEDGDDDDDDDDDDGGEAAAERGSDEGDEDDETGSEDQDDGEEEEEASEEEMGRLSTDAPIGKRRKSAEYRLADVPTSLASELESFETYRTLEVNRLRSCAACVPITVSNDIAVCRRFLGWLQDERLLPSSSTDLLTSVFGSEMIASWTEMFLDSLRARDTKASTQAKYVSSIYLITSYVFDTGRPSPAALHLHVRPTTMLKNMRSQCEANARQARLYSTSATSVCKFLDWPTVQKTRVRAMEAYSLCPVTKRAKKFRLLSDVLILFLHSVQCPDRVGITRLLQLGVTLVPNGSGYNLDLTMPGQHKTAAVRHVPTNTRQRTTSCALLCTRIRRCMALLSPRSLK